MQPFSVRELRLTDAPALLAFEADNREWFESHIAARDEAFYSLAGVVAHINDYLSGLARGVWHPFVIEDACGAIVGRANLKDIDGAGRCAQVGYRIAHAACGQGLATLALRHLISEAQGRWRLTQLVAQVIRGNLGSSKVLLKCGFVPDASSSSEAVPGEHRLTLDLPRLLPSP